MGPPPLLLVTLDTKMPAITPVPATIIAATSPATRAPATTRGLAIPEAITPARVIKVGVITLVLGITRVETLGELVEAAALDLVVEIRGVSSSPRLEIVQLLSYL